MHPERVVIARVSAVVATVVTITIVVATASLPPPSLPSGFFSLGTSSQM
jgi:hypothetical protein